MLGGRYELGGGGGDIMWMDLLNIPLRDNPNRVVDRCQGYEVNPTFKIHHSKSSSSVQVPSGRTSL